MSRNWKPGDVAMVTGRWVWCEPHSDSIAFRVDAWTWQRANGACVGDHAVSEVRPLAVIDPEDREQIVSLIGLYCAEFNERYEPTGRHLLATDAMQAALREYAEPTPPKPDEPLGLGAVVVDADGELWVRDKTTTTISHWKRARGQMGGNRVRYSEIAAVKILSEGVTQ